MGLIEQRRKILLNTPHIQTSTSNNFSTDIVAPLKALEIEFEPIQSGTGTPAPDNIRPIDGSQQVSVRHFGKNLFNKASVTPSNMTCYTSSGDPVTRNGIEYYLPAGTYTLKCHSETIYTYVYTNIVDTNRNFVSFAALSMGAAAGWRKVTITLTKGQYLLIFKGTTTTLDLNMNLQIECGTEATDYTSFVEGGVNSITFPALGKNLYDCAEFSSYKQADGTYRLTGANATTAKVYFPEELVGKEIVLSVYLDLTKETGPTYIRLRAVVDRVNQNGATIYNNDSGYSTVTVTPTSTSDYFYMTYGSNGSNYYTFSQFQVEIKTGSSRTSYEPYTNTVYGGTLDLVTGVLTINRKLVTVTSVTQVSGTYIKSDAIDGYATNNDIYPRIGYLSQPADLIADKLKLQRNAIWSVVGYPNCWMINSNQIHINVANDLLGVTDYTQETAATAKEKLNAWLAENPVTVTIPITPTTYQLIPQQIKTLKKTNTFFADNGNIIKVMFWKH